MMKICNLGISEEYKELIPRPTEEDKDVLRQDIKKNGIKIPIVINEDNVLIDGYTRNDIAKGLGFEEVPVEIRGFKDKREETYFIFQVNSFRRHYTTAQRVVMALKLLEFEKEKAKKRQREHGKTAPGKTKTIVGHEPTTVSGKARDIVAKQTGLSSKTLQSGIKIDAVIKNLKDEPKKDVLKKCWNDAVAGKKSVKSVYRKAKKFDEEESQKPKKRPNVSKFLVKQLSTIKYKIDSIRARDIIAIEDEHDRDIAIQTIDKMISHLKKQLDKIGSPKPKESNISGITKKLQMMEKKKDAGGVAHSI